MVTDILSDAKKVIAVYAQTISQALKDYVSTLPTPSDLANLPLYFSNAYQNPILTTAVVSTNEAGQVMTYAGTGGYGCFGPPTSPGDANYPLSLSQMWIRDACAQYHAYLGIFLANGDKPLTPELQSLAFVIEGVVRTCASFLVQNSGLGKCQGKAPPTPDGIPSHVVLHAMNPGLDIADNGCDYEPDSLAYLIFLAAELEAAANWTSHLDDTFWQAMNAILNIIASSDKSEYGYLHVFPDGSALTRTPFRPSDDVCKCYFNVPVNAFIASMMGRLSTLANNHGHPNVAKNAAQLNLMLTNGIKNHCTGTVEGISGDILYYETNAGITIPNIPPPLSNVPLAEDDANIPSLLSLQYFNFGNGDPIIAQLYETTRNELVLTSANKYYYQKSCPANPYDIQGVGSSHTDGQNGGTLTSVWPMSIMMRGLTAEVAEDPITERYSALVMLVAAAGPNQYSCENICAIGGFCDCSNNDQNWKTYPSIGYQHESVDISTMKTFTRGWFAWANALFGEWVESMARNNLLPVSSSVSEK